MLKFVYDFGIPDNNLITAGRPMDVFNTGRLWLEGSQHLTSWPQPQVEIFQLRGSCVVFFANKFFLFSLKKYMLQCVNTDYYPIPPKTDG